MRLQTKKTLVENLITANNVSVIAITETKCQNVSLKEHNVFSRRANGVSRGVALAVANHIYKTELPIPEATDLHVCDAVLRTRSSPLNVIALYIPLNSEWPHDFISRISATPRTIIMGNFNARHISIGDNSTNTKGRLLVR